MKQILLILIFASVACGRKASYTSQYQAPLPVDVVVPPAIEPVEKLNDGLLCSFYDLSQLKPSKLPDFTKLVPLMVDIPVNGFNVTDRSYKDGLPLMPAELLNYKEWYAITCKGLLKLDKKDLYTLYLTADDGANLYIDGFKVIDNDGLHAPRTIANNIILDEGLHEIELHYYQGPATQIALTLEISDSETKRSLLTQNNLKHKE